MNKWLHTAKIHARGLCTVKIHDEGMVEYTQSRFMMRSWRYTQPKSMRNVFFRVVENSSSCWGFLCVYCLPVSFIISALMMDLYTKQHWAEGLFSGAFSVNQQ